MHGPGKADWKSLPRGSNFQDKIRRGKKNSQVIEERVHFRHREKRWCLQRSRGDKEQVKQSMVTNFKVVAGRDQKDH
jgi:hypothetical protein